MGYNKRQAGGKFKADGLSELIKWSLLLVMLRVFIFFVFLGNFVCLIFEILNFLMQQKLMNFKFASWLIGWE